MSIIKFIWRQNRHGLPQDVNRVCNCCCRSAWFPSYAPVCWMILVHFFLALYLISFTSELVPWQPLTLGLQWFCWTKPPLLSLSHHVFDSLSFRLGLGDSFASFLFLPSLVCVKSQENRQRPGYCNVWSKQSIPCIWYATCITGQTKEGLGHSQAYGMIKPDPALIFLLLHLLGMKCTVWYRYSGQGRKCGSSPVSTKCICMSSQVWMVTCVRFLFTVSPLISTGASGWLEWFLSAGEGWRDPVPADA